VNIENSLGEEAGSVDFRLVYRGELPTDGSKEEKHRIRRIFHTQLRELWAQEPLKTNVENFNLCIDPRYENDPDHSTFERCGPFLFLPLVTARVSLVAKVDILFLRPQPPGSLVTHAGDLDNRIKTLFDSMTTPRDLQQLPDGIRPGADETPYFTLLQDDALITGFSVQTDRLLDARKASEVLLIIRVDTCPIRSTWQNIGL